MEAPYKTPETHPGIPTQFPKNNKGWSNTKVTMITIFPMTLSIFFGILLSCVGGDVLDKYLGLLICFVTILAFVCAVTTAIQYYQSRKFNIYGQVILWGSIHTALLGFGVFTGCIILVSNFHG